MKTDTHLQRFKTLLIEGIKIIAVPALLIYLLITVWISLVLSTPSGNFTFLDGIELGLIGIILFMLFDFLGIALISLVLVYWRKALTDVSAFFWGAIIGLVGAIIVNFVLMLIFSLPAFFLEDDLLLEELVYMVFAFVGSIISIYSLSSIATIFILAYAARRLNKASITEIVKDIPDDSKEKVRIEFLGAWLAAQVAIIGCVVLFVIRTIYDLLFEGSNYLSNVIVDSVIMSGFALAITLPLALLGGYLLGSFVKREQNKGSLTKRKSIVFGMLVGIFALTGIFVIVGILVGGIITDPYFLGLYFLSLIIAAIAGAVVGKRLFSNGDVRIIHLKDGKKWFKIILKVAAVLLAVYGAVLGIIYLRLTIPSDRELWRSTEFGVFDSIVLNNLLLFEGFKVGDSDDCDYIFAFDKTTGEMIWSTENIEKLYCGEPESPRRTIISTSENDNVVFMSFSYWTVHDWSPLDMTISYILYALRGTDGEVLWKVDGFAGDSPLEYSIVETGAIFVINKEGFFSAIDSRTGHPIWEQEIPEMNYWDDTIIIEYYDQIVYYYDSGNKLLIAFDAITGNPIWEISPQTNIGEIMVSDKLIYLVTSSSEETTDHPYKKTETVEVPYQVTALEIETGKRVWELPFEQKYPIAEIIGNEVFILTSEWQGEPDNYHWLGVLDVVNKTTGEMLWQFDGDSSNGDNNNKVIDFLVEGDFVYVCTEGGVIFALENETGEIIWQTETSGFPFYLIVEAGMLIAVYEEEYVVGLDTKTGARKWVADIRIADAWDFHKFLKVADGVIYLSGTLDQKIFAIDIETGREVWSWQHNHPNDKRYYLETVDDNVIYVDQSLDTIFGRHWFFALKTEP